MKELSFGSGLVTYLVNGKREVSFNPTDSSFIEQLHSSFDELDKKQECYKERIAKMKENKEIFTVARELDGEMRVILDGILGEGFCDDVFGAMNVYALADGLPAWANLLLAIMDEVDVSFANQQKQSNDKIQKYVKKYKR